MSLLGRIWSNLRSAGGKLWGAPAAAAMPHKAGNQACFSCSSQLNGGVIKEGEDPKKLSETDWQKRLSPEEYHVTRQHGTEPAFQGSYTYEKQKGIYLCKCCGTELFSSDTKYDSGSGWPAFYEALGASGKDDKNSNVTRIVDNSHGMRRVEVRCKQCDAHLGHVFSDGPKPTGQRYCVNSISLTLKSEDGKL